MTQVAALIPAAGRGERAGQEVAKQFREIAGRSVLSHSVAAAARDRRVVAIMLVLPADASPPDDIDVAGLTLAICAGGASRAGSVLNGVRAIGESFPSIDHVLVHDAARPCLHPDDLRAVLDAGLADDHGAILARRLSDTLKRGGERIEATVRREGLWRAQTPQVFSVRMLKAALEAAGDVTDEASAMEQAGFRPRLVTARHPNLKITWTEDLKLAEALLLRTVA